MANITRWEPFREAVSLRDAMDRLFDESFLKPFGDGSLMDYQWPSVNLTETGDEIIVKAALPGMKPEDVKISLTGNVLKLSGEFSSESEKSEDKGVTYHLREHHYGAFSRTITLPTTVQGDKVQAEYENGIVTLTLPKAEEARPKTVNIKVKK
jgi:HSP20 family protein